MEKRKDRAEKLVDKKDNKKQYKVRNLRHDEIGLLKDFLYEAIYVPEGVKPPASEILELPELKIYIEEFGTRRGDNCLVADFGGKAAGAVWARIMDDYGHVYANYREVQRYDFGNRETASPSMGGERRRGFIPICKPS